VTAASPCSALYSRSGDARALCYRRRVKASRKNGMQQFVEAMHRQDAPDAPQPDPCAMRLWPGFFLLLEVVTELRAQKKAELAKRATR